MATMVIMPRQGQSVESCVISSWEKAVGDPVQEGDVLFSYETDKASFEETAKVSGTLLAILCKEQDDVPCLANVAVIGEKNEDISALISSEERREPDTPVLPVPSESVCLQAAHIPESTTSVTGVSPRARFAAQKLHVDPANVSASGPNGRVIERDIIAARNAAFAGNSVCQAAEESAHVENSPVDYRDEKISHMRQIIAGSMHDSLSKMAQLTHHTSFDATAMMEYRTVLKAYNEDYARITYNDIILFTVSRVLKNHPYLNAHWLEGQNTIRLFSGVHLGMAVDTPRGLLVVTIRNAEKKSLFEISREAKALAAEAQNGAINPDKLTGATFTISNLGTFGVELFTPVINPPQTGILGVDCIVDRVRKCGNEISVYPAMGLSLTYDHRAMDGAPASRFLKELREALEHVTAILAE